MDKYLEKTKNKETNFVPTELSASDSSSSDSSSSDDVPRTNKSTRKYEQKIRSSWLKDKRFEKWILRDGDKLMCKFCHCRLLPKLCGLLKHCSSQKHKSAMTPFVRGVQPSISFQREKENDVYRAELSNALFVAAHTSIRSIDHLTKMQKKIFHNSKTASELALGRTKCSALIKNVLFPHFTTLLIKDIGDYKFSLLIDESTDISVKKYLGIVIRYYSTKNKAIVNTFLKLVEIENCTAEGIVEAVLTTLKMYKLNIKNMVGLGTDNANVMVGINRGVIARLKQYNSEIRLVPCICHSIQIAVSSASDCIPNEVEFLVAEIYNWFSKSSPRQKKYAALFSAINGGTQPRKVLRACNTRWLSIEPAIKRVVEQWLELKTHFQIAALTELCIKTKLLASMFSDINLAYLQFLKVLLSEVQKVNKLFESNEADPTKLFAELVFLISNLCNNLISPSENFDPLSSPIEHFLAPAPRFYYSFEEFVRLKKDEMTIDDEEEKDIRNTCQRFVIKLIMQLRQRLPKNIETLRNIDFFSVENTLRIVKPDIFTYFKKENFSFDVDKITNLEIQWRKVHTYPWTKVSSSIDFWIEVKEFKDALNENPFSALTNFVFQFLLLPLSNAEIERTFSTMNLIKTKQRNSIKLVMLNSILTIRYGLKKMNKCCYDYIINDDIIKFMKRQDIYEDIQDSSDSDESMELEI